MEGTHATNSAHRPQFAIPPCQSVSNRRSLLEAARCTVSFTLLSPLYNSWRLSFSIRPSYGRKREKKPYCLVCLFSKSLLLPTPHFCSLPGRYQTVWQAAVITGPVSVTAALNSTAQDHVSLILCQKYLFHSFIEKKIKNNKKNRTTNIVVAKKRTSPVCDQIQLTLPTLLITHCRILPI